MAISRMLRRPRTWLIVAAVVLVLPVIGFLVYVNFIEDDPPPRLAFENSPTSTVGTGDTPITPIELDGSWEVATGSEAGYRVEEVLFGRDTEAVGRTTKVTGALRIDDQTVEEASFTVDMTSVESSEDRRDRQFHERIMDTGTFPTATFVLTDPVEIGSVPTGGEQVTVSVKGDFAIHGLTRSVTFDLSARRNGSAFEVQGRVPVVFADFDIPDASFGPATVKDHGEIEFLLKFEKA